MKKFFAILFVQAFLLNFVWEVTQMPLYLSTGMGERDNYIRFLSIHWRVSLFDALTIIIAYLLVGLIMQNIRWGITKNKIAWSVFILGLLGWQILVEYLSVYVYHRWAYAASMPLVFGIGISPLFQMIFLGALVILFSRQALSAAAEK